MFEKLTQVERMTVELWMTDRLPMNHTMIVDHLVPGIKDPVTVSEDLLRRFCLIQMEDKRRLQEALKRASTFANNNGHPDMAKTLKQESCSQTIE